MNAHTEKSQFISCCVLLQATNRIPSWRLCLRIKMEKRTRLPQSKALIFLTLQMNTEKHQNTPPTVNTQDVCVCARALYYSLTVKLNTRATSAAYRYLISYYLSCTSNTCGDNTCLFVVHGYCLGINIYSTIPREIPWTSWMWRTIIQI